MQSATDVRIREHKWKLKRNKFRTDVRKLFIFFFSRGESHMWGMAHQARLLGRRHGGHWGADQMAWGAGIIGKEEMRCLQRLASGSSRPCPRACVLGACRVYLAGTSTHHAFACSFHRLRPSQNSCFHIIKMPAAERERKREGRERERESELDPCLRLLLCLEGECHERMKCTPLPNTQTQASQPPVPPLAAGAPILTK